MSKAEQDSIAKALKQWKSEESNLYSHLSSMICDMPTDTANGLIHLERISEYFKKVRFQNDSYLRENQLKNKNNKKIQYPQWWTACQWMKQSIKKSKTPSISEKSASRLIQNFQKDNQCLFSPIGYSFGSQQSYRIDASIKLLAEKQNAKSLRFFGKIIGRDKDYFVIQGQAIKNKQYQKQSDDMQPYGQGVNYYSFWVSDRIVGVNDENWYELPMITPEQMRVSRLIKYAFTGNLKAPVKAYPNFAGEERHLLKCQLVRIAHNCEIVPNNLFSKNEENPDVIDFSEQFKMPDFADLTNLQNWVHLNPFILQSGRYKHYASSLLSAEQKDQLLAKLSENDPPIQRLKPINEDKPIEKLGLETCWFARQTGNLQLFNNIGKDQGTTSCYGSVILRNPHWSGWITTANNKGFGSIYIGYGYKSTQSCFYPMTNQDLLQQGEDIDGFDEPNPRDPPDELEPDSDDDNKKEAE